MSKRSKIILVGVVSFVVLLTIGLSVGLSLALRPKIVEVKSINKVSFEDGSVVGHTEMVL
jgi:hypothetical protein